MCVADLTKIAIPPQSPICNGRAEDWGFVERVLGFSLPKDYKSVINCYGMGYFLRFLRLFSPFDPFSSRLNLLSGDTKQILSAYESGRGDFPEYSPPFHAYPTESGLFPWATTVNGDVLFWLMRGAADKWPTVLCDSKFSEDYEIIDMGVAPFLCRWIAGQLSPKAFPRNLITDANAFVPHSGTGGQKSD